MMDHSQDFPTRSHHVQRWYVPIYEELTVVLRFGLKDFVLICHQTDTSRMGVSEASLLLSTVSIALNNLASFHMPVLIPIYEKWSGTCIDLLWRFG